MATGGDGFPGLNKRHGFFRAIERNQVDRDTYHWKQESHKVEVKKKSRRKRPDKALYMPPSLRKTQPQAEESNGGAHPQAEESNGRAVYRLKVEVSPGQWHEQNVERYDMAVSIATKVACSYNLGRNEEKALVSLIEDFEKLAEGN